MIQEVSDFLENYVSPEHAKLTPDDTAQMIKKIKEKKQKAKELENEAQQIEAVLKSLCPHPDKTVDQQYFASDYYNGSYTEYTVRCLVCNSQLFKHTKQNGQ